MSECVQHLILVLPQAAGFRQFQYAVCKKPDRALVLERTESKIKHSGGHAGLRQ
jgi:hypothetical protein